MSDFCPETIDGLRFIKDEGVRRISPGPGENPLIAVALLGHGSRRGRSTYEGLREVARRLAERLAMVGPVEPAFFEFLAPTLEETLDAFHQREIRNVVVMPYFLFDGKEIKRDIPALLDSLRSRFPVINIVLASNLGIDDRLLALLRERVFDALRGLGQYLPIGARLPMLGDDGRVGVVVVNRGSRQQYDDGSRLRELCERLEARLDGAPVQPAQAERSPTLTLANAVDRLVAADCERLVVVPYLHFPGKVLFSNVIPVVNGLAARYPKTRFYLASTLCVDDRLVDICVDRITECLPG